MIRSFTKNLGTYSHDKKLVPITKKRVGMYQITMDEFSFRLKLMRLGVQFMWNHPNRIKILDAQLFKNLNAKIKVKF